MIHRIRQGWEQVSLYLPVMLMGLLALGTWWLVRNAPMPQLPTIERPLGHQPDYFMKTFSVKSFDAAGRLQSEVQGEVARHYPDTDTLEIDKVNMRSVSPEGRRTVATANRALTNADGTEVQLFGNAIVTREPVPAKAGHHHPTHSCRQRKAKSPLASWPCCWAASASTSSTPAHGAGASSTSCCASPTSLPWWRWSRAFATSR